MTIREFKVSVDESKIDDLYKRIDLTRWPDEVNDCLLYTSDAADE